MKGAGSARTEPNGFHFELPRHPAHRERGERSWRERLFGRPARRRESSDPSPALPPALQWVDEFIANVRSFVVVRPEDRLLIRMPNQAHRLNAMGVRVLGFLLDGGTAAELFREIGEESRRTRDVTRFLLDVRRCLSGELREDNAGCGVEIVPLDLHFSDLPVLSEVALTRRCNLRCVFCYAGCGNGPRSHGRAADPTAFGFPESPAPESEDSPVPDMETREVETILRRIRNRARVPSVSFTGGEPTLRPDLAHLVRYAARDLGMRTNLITNGTRVDADLAGRLAESGLASAQVSIEAPGADLHDAIVGVPGAFERSRRAVAHFRTAGVSVHANTTIHRRNFHAAAEMPRFAREILGLDRLSMNMVIPAGSAAGESRDSPLVRYSEIAEAVLAVQRAAAAADVEFLWYSPTPLCLFNPILADLGNKGCSACDGLLSIDARGRVLPCSSCEDPVGDLLREDFSAIWQGARAARYRNKELAHPACRACEHFPFCHGACPLYWNHFGFDELVAARGFPPCPPPRIPPADDPDSQTAAWSGDERAADPSPP